MTAHQTHSLLRQRFELTARSQADAMAAQERVATLMEQGPLIAAIDSVLSAAVDAGQLLRLDRLELDVGTLVLAEMDGAWVPRITAALAREIEQTLGRESRDAPSAHNAIANDTASDGAALEYRDLTQARLDALAIFLETGFMPSWAATLGIKDVVELLDTCLASQPQLLHQVLRQLDPDRSLSRLVKQLPPTSLERLLVAFADVVHEDAGELLQWRSHIGELLNAADAISIRFDGQHSFSTLVSLQSLVLPRTSTQQFAEHRLHLLQRAMNLHLSNPETIYAQLSRALPGLRDLPVRDPPVLARPAGHSPGSIRNPESEQHYHTDPGRTQADASVAGQSVNSGIDQITRTATGPRETGAGEPRDACAAPRLEESAAPDATSLPQQSISAVAASELEQLLTGGCYVENAGLILLWPFLPEFMSSLELVEGSDFVSPSAREKAILLLQHLVTGETRWSEPLLVLNKLLCDWPIEEPIDAEFTPSERERAETDAMLKAVIDHWPVMRGTSHSGFREGFLLREGRLTQRDEGWQLHIARAGRDVLLDSLPWGISLVRLPWMPQAIMADW